MPTTHFSEAALDVRRQKQALAAALPGRLDSWTAAAGRTVAGTLPLDSGELVVFTDGAYLFARPAPLAGDALVTALLAARTLLEPHHGAVLAELERLAAAEREAMRLARMEKVLGAVETNLPQIPELRAALEKLLACTSPK